MKINDDFIIRAYQHKSLKATKDLLYEILNLCNINEDVDEIFYFNVFLVNEAYVNFIIDNHNEEYPSDMPKLHGDWGTQEKRNSILDFKAYLTELKRKITIGESEKPEWMKVAEINDNSKDKLESTELLIFSKDLNYNKIARKIMTLLNSVYSDCECVKNKYDE